MKKNFIMKCVAALAMLLVPLPLMFVFEVAAFSGFVLWHYLIYYAVAGAVTASGYLAMSIRSSRHTPKTIFLSNMLIVGFGAAIVILVAVIYIGQQVYQGLFVADNIANFAHIIGGAVGAIIGFNLNGRR